MCYVLYGDDLSLLCYAILAMMVAFPHVAIIYYNYIIIRVVFFCKMLYFILIDYYS